MVEGLLAAAEMAEFAAAAKQRESGFYEARGARTRALELRGQSQALLDIAKAIRVRAAQTDTGSYVPIGDPGPGWERRLKRTTQKVRVIRRTWRNVLDAILGREG